MPRPVRVKSPIRDLRTIIEKTQRELALSIGISPIALNRIENGTLALSRRVARKIFFETGVYPRCLHGKPRALRNIQLEQYTKEFYEAWKDHYLRQDEDMAKNVAGLLGSRMEILLQASVTGSRKRMWVLYVEIAEILDRCRVDFNLERPISAILAKQQPPEKWEDPLRIARGWPREWERKKATAPQKPRSSPRRRRKA